MCLTTPSSHGRIPMLDGAPITAIGRFITSPESRHRGCGRTEDPTRRGRWDLDDNRGLGIHGVAGSEGRGLLNRLEVHNRRLVIEAGLEQIHLRLQEVALRLRDEKCRRQSNLVAAPFGVEPLLRQRRACPSSVDSLGAAVNLPAGPPHRFGGLNARGSRSAARPGGVRPPTRARLAAS